MGGGPARDAPDNGGNSKQRRRVVVIGGGGPAGLAALRVFLERPQLTGSDASWEIQAYEARSDVGGLWLSDHPDTAEGSNALHLDAPEPWTPPVSPQYDSLTTNVANPIMAFHDFLFPPETPLYPHGTYVQKYLASYADYYGLRRFIQFNAPVRDLRWDAQSSKWIVRRDILTSSSPGEAQSVRQVEDVFDAAIIATGRYQVPYRPPISGLADWEKAGRRTMHSVSYRKPSIFDGLVVLVVGAMASGVDISRDAVGVASTILLSSSRGVYSNDESVKHRARLVELRAKDGVALYADGKIDQGIDLVVFATGYRIAFPFFQDLKHQGPPRHPSPDHLVLSDYSIYPLAQHTFPLKDYSPHTLAIMGLPRGLTIFRALDTQAQAIATVFLEPAPWNQQREEYLLQRRFLAMKRKHNGNFSEMAKHFHDVISDGDPDLDTWITYRTSLLELAGRQEWAIEPWEIELNELGDVMRKEWVTLVEEGVADEWLKGVGLGGMSEWIDFMWKVVRHARARKMTLSILDAINL